MFQGAVTQMVEQGFRQSSQASVETASELYENATSRNVTGEDVTRLYHHLGQMTAGEIEKFATATPEVNRYSLPLPVNDEQLRAWPSGLDGARWWDGMDEPQRDAMLSFLPLLTGNTEGVPYRKRHDANMKVLNEVSKDNYLEEYKENFDSIRESLLPGPSEEGGENHSSNRLLISLDLGAFNERPRQPLAAVSVGDPDEKAATTFSIPGMDSGTHNMTGEVDRAQEFHDEVGDHAVVAWMGYDPPTLDETIPESLDRYRSDDGALDLSWEDLRVWEFEGGEAWKGLFENDGSVMNDVRADEGGYRFAYAVDSHQQAAHARGNLDQQVNVLAHSYGSNMVSHALTRNDPALPVDRVIYVGSSGIPEDVAGNSSDLNVKDAEHGAPAVFAGQSTSDRLASWGQGNIAYGPYRGDIPGDLFDSPRIDPRAEEFDAYIFSVDGDEPSWYEPWKDDPDLNSVTGHSRYYPGADQHGYFNDGTQSFDSIVRLLRGDVGSVERESTWW